MFFARLLRKKNLALASLVIAVPAMAAGEIDMLTEDDLLVEIPIVSSVTHMEQTLPQTPASVTIIDRQTIQASTAVDINDLFRLVPGFDTYYVNGGRKGVTYHALGDEYPRRLEVKIDGRSVYESLFSAVIWSTIGVDIEDIEYIEVVRGANAAADGSNAFLASINIVTRSPLLDAGFSFRTQMGSAQTRNAAVTYSGKVGNIDQRTTLSFRSNDGFDDGIFLGRSISINDDSEAISFTSKGLWTPSSTDNIEFQIGLAESDLWIGKDEFTNRDMSYQYQYLNWNHLTEHGNSLQLIAYHNDLELKDEMEPQRISEVIGVDDSSPFWPLGSVPDTTIFDGSNVTHSERWDIELRTSLQPADKLRAVTGAAVRHDRVSGQIAFDTLDTLSEVSYRAYTNFEWTKSESLILNGGLILEDRKSTGSYASYRIAANYISSEDHMFRAAFNRSFRAPTLLENNQKGFVRYVNPQECSSGQTTPECNPLFRDLILDASVISDSDISNEELKSYELGYAGYFINRSLNVDMRLYYEQMRDVIAERRNGYPDLDNFVNIRDNTDTMDVRGIEFQAVYEPSERLLLRGQYSYSDIDGISCYTSPVSAGEPCQEYRDLDYRSLKNTLGLLTSYRLDNGISLSSMVSYNSSKSSFFKGSKLDDFTRIDLKAAKNWQIGQSSIDISFTVENVGDAYAEFIKYNIFKTRYILGLKANFL
jgi:iron complex outermembrane receptor protein